MDHPVLNLIVVRSPEPDRAVDFYQALGIDFQQERHGTGPLHWAADLEGIVFEVYPADTSSVDRSTRLGFQVLHVDDLVERLRARDVTIVQEAKTSPWGRRAVVRDPDGRSVELNQQQ